MDTAREIDVVVNFLADTAEIRRVSREINRVTNNSEQATYNAANMGRTYSSEYQRWRKEQALLTEESKAMQREMKYGWMAAGDGYAEALNNMVKARYGIYKLTQASYEWQRSTRSFMGEVDALGNQMKHANDDLINHNNKMRQSFFQTAATMRTMTTQAQRISENYQRMRNPIYLVNTANLALADSLNKVANRGKAASLALELLGPKASNKELLNMITMINQGLMRTAFVAIGAAVSSYFLYGAMHKAAMGNAEYANSFQTMLKTVREALQPMVDVFISIMTVIYDFVTAMAELVIKFNEAHPVLAKFIQGTMLLVPALTLLLSPLAIGIGLLAGFRAALAGAWPIIGPIVTGLAAMSSTVWLVAAALVGLTMVFTQLWRENEQFRTVIVDTWETVKNTIMQAVQAINPYLQMFLDKVVEVFNNVKEAIANAFTGDFSGILDIFKTILPGIIAIIVGGIPGLIIAVANMMYVFRDTIMSNKDSIIDVFMNILDSIVNFLSTQVVPFIQAGIAMIKNLVDGLVKNMPAIQSAMLKVVETIITTLTQILPQILEAGISLLQTLVEGMTTTLPKVFEVIKQVLTTLVEAISTNLPLIANAAIEIIMMLVTTIIENIPMILDIGIQIITALVGAILENLPMLLNAGLEILMGLVTAIIEALPTLLEAAIQILLSLIDMIIENLPLLITAAIEILTKLVVSLIELLPMLLDVAVQLLLTLVDGIIELLPTLIPAALEIIKTLFQALIDNLPTIWNAAMEIVLELAKGIIDNLPSIIASATDLVATLIEEVLKAVPLILKAAWDIIKSFVSGIQDKASDVLNAIWEICTGIVDKIMEVDLFDAGANLVKGLANGITSAGGKAIDAAKSLGSSIKEKVEGLWGVASPAKEFIKIGEFASQGLAIGIENDAMQAIKSSQDLANGVSDKYINETASNSYDYSKSSNTTNKNNLTVNINATGSADGGQDVKDQVLDALEQHYGYLDVTMG